MPATGAVKGEASSVRARLVAKSDWAAVLIVVAAAALALWLLGRTPICTCGTVKLWHGVVHSAENSQQLSDWYSLSHFIHGLIFYGLYRLAGRASPTMPRLGLGLIAATLIEAGWEVLENSPIIIDRYRSVTMAWGYAGDSIINSLSDIAFMVAGFLVAARLPAWAIIAIAVALELLALAAIRDNLTLNIWMLVAPNDAIVAWQNS